MAPQQPHPNPETVEALLDTTWRVASIEAAQTEALDRKATALATFASLVLTLTAGVGRGFLRSYSAWWAYLLYALGLALLVAAIVEAVRALLPKEYRSLGMAYLERFPKWSEILKPPEQVRGETMAGLIQAIAQERGNNNVKAQHVGDAFRLLLVGLILVAVEAATLGAKEIF